METQLNHPPCSSFRRERRIHVLGPDPSPLPGTASPREQPRAIPATPAEQLMARLQCAVCSARPPTGNATPGSAAVITLLAAPFIEAQEKGIKAAHVCSLTKPLGARRGYGIPVPGSRCPARSGYGRPRSQAPGRGARLCRPGSTRAPARLSATPTPLPHTRGGRRRRGRSAGPGVKGERSAGPTPPGIATAAAR